METAVRQMLELRGRLLECEQEKLRLEEQLAQAGCAFFWR